MFSVIQSVLSLKKVTLDDYREYFNEIYNSGVWYAEDMAASRDFIDLSMGTELEERTNYWVLREFYDDLNDEQKQKIKGIKYFSDGAPSAKSAYVTEKYPGTESYGSKIFTDDQYSEFIIDASKLGKSLAIHACGDKAIHQVVSVVDSNRKSLLNIPEIRIEHSQFIDLETAKTAKKLGIILCMQPNFSYETNKFKKLLSSNYLEGNNPFRMLIDTVGFVPGKDLIFGSDGMRHGVVDLINNAFLPVLESQRLYLDEIRLGYCLEDYSHGKIEIDFKGKELDNNNQLDDSNYKSNVEKNMDVKLLKPIK